MTVTLLTGAGFSRNWNGPLASDIFNALLGAGLDERTCGLLVEHHKSGFEDALFMLQQAVATDPSLENKHRLDQFLGALRSIFNGLRQPWWDTEFEFQTDLRYMVRTWLIKFDAIFTLNQDTLLEQRYLDDNVLLGSNGRWQGWDIPGTKLFGLEQPYYDSRLARTRARIPDPGRFILNPRYQPYFKLHGSSLFVADESGKQILVMGGNKPGAIASNPLLTWYHREFVNHISRPGARLMIVGYGFNDQHINDALAAAAGQGLSIFLVNTAGYSIFDGRPDLAKIAAAVTGGISQRLLSTTFGDDRVEHGRLMEFLL
jgi:hypothetical protein